MKIKNVRPGIVIITDAGLKLAPGDTVSVDALTAQMERAVEAGVLARIDDAPQAAKLSAKGVSQPPDKKPETVAAASTVETTVATSADEGAGAQGKLIDSDPAASGATKDSGQAAKTVGAKNGSA